MKVLRIGCVFAGFLSLALSMPAQTFQTRFTFDGTDGMGPVSDLLQATDGNLYGTASAEGAGPYGSGGTIFKIAPSGSLTTVYNFCSQSGCTDGEYPRGVLVQAADGNFYGVTEFGGANNAGTVFKITPSGTLTTIHSFCSQSNCTDGENPCAGLVLASNGNLYGTTYVGGLYNGGAVFEITPSGTLTTLYSFCSQSGCPDGANPFAPLIQGADGNFYGTTYGYYYPPTGGAVFKMTLKPPVLGSGGTVFQLTPSGTLTTLHSFCSQSDCTDGANPVAPLVQSSDGNFYGTTGEGGADTTGCADFGCGTVFKITPSGTLTTLHSFYLTDGGYPVYGGLVQATDGNFYGTALVGGADTTTCFGYGCGTVFRITPGGTLTTLHSFCLLNSCPDGAYPYGGVIQDTNGTFYGATQASGAHEQGDGTVFGFRVGLGPFVEAQPTSGRVGAIVKILGTNLTGATSVTFNGTPAVFKVLASSLIRATVPEGATTGTVQVVTPSGTLSSNKEFRVTPVISGFSPTSGPAGTSSVITSNSLTGATSVTFGGVKATTFTVNSDMQVTGNRADRSENGKDPHHLGGWDRDVCHEFHADTDNLIL
jgi:uncharacterized repeat protein (TIGR03803 family)